MPSLPAFNRRPLSLWFAVAVSTLAPITFAQTDNNSPEKTTRLKTVKVETTAIDGSTDAGYKIEEISQIGVWGDRKLQDTPYSINVVSKELIENLQANSADQIFKVTPVTQFFWPQAQNDNPYVFLRGFQTTTFARDGIARQKWNYAHGTVMEEMERIEVLTGLSGFLYGGGNIGGMVNFITKKPTQERFNSITLGNAGGENYYAHGDFGGQIDEEGIFGYRINMVTQNGETDIKHQHNEREFYSAAFDWEATDNLLINIDLSKRNYHLDGRNAYWTVPNNAKRPDADDIDVDKTWGQPWNMQIMDSERIGASLRWDISDDLRVRSGYLDENNSRTGTTVTNTVLANGLINQRASTNKDAPQVIDGDGKYVFVDWGFYTGNIQHTLTAGGQRSTSIWTYFPDGSPAAQDYNGLSLNNPVYVPEPNWAVHGTQPTYPNYDQRSYTQTLGDDIRFNSQWSALVGLSNSKVYAKTFSTEGVETAFYDKSKVTPTLSVIYKPVEYLTTYASYMEGLEQGGVAGKQFQTYDVINSDEIMEPLISEQIELGAKASIGDLLLTGAIFSIDKPLEYYLIHNQTQAEFIQDGRQVHKGIEFTATGKLTDHLTLLGGLTLLDAEVKENKQRPEIEGKKPVGVSEKLIKFYTEYHVVSIPGLSINGGASYTGDFFGNDINTDKLPAYTLIDVGARYQMEVKEKLLTLRINANNLTDEHYWANQSFLGNGRTIVFSANIQL
ncbi:MAG TPA: TonB-dependent siderophore receptor [Cellvibrio sp.]|nr:TonB-dependent siderophore receptor [Cellvibrio sp.]